MPQHKPRRATLAHVVTALAVVLIAAVLASGPLGRSPQPNQSAQVATVPLTLAGSGAQPSPPDGAEGAGREDASLSARGGRGLDGHLPEPSPVPLVQPSPSPSSTPRPVVTITRPATPPPSPTATPLPTSASGLRVGIQAGHWRSSELPSELASLRGSTGAAGNGWKEVDINLDIARRVVALLEAQKLQVDLIPATVPSRYKADAFVALHGDANAATGLSGYKLARARWSTIPSRDDALLSAISTEYRAATGLPEHPATITLAMIAYYAFDQRLQYAVAPTTPSVILEMGFLTNPGDRVLLTQQQDRVAEGIVKGILKFLER